METVRKNNNKKSDYKKAMERIVSNNELHVLAMKKLRDLNKILDIAINDNTDLQGS